MSFEKTLSRPLAVRHRTLLCDDAVEFLTKVFDLDELKIKAQIWDTAGQERFNAMMSSYYRKAKGAMLVYDISCRSSFDNIAKWADELLQHV